MNNMMNYDEFKEIIVKEFPVELAKTTGAEYDVRQQKVEKANNGVAKDALICLEKESNVAPTLYIDDMYRYYKDVEDMSLVVDKYISLYVKGMKEVADVSAVQNFLTDPERILKNVYPFLVNLECNKGFLKDVPYLQWHDLAVIFKVEVAEVAGGAWTVIRNEHMDAWANDIDISRLKNSAYKNAIKKMRISDMASVLKGICCYDELSEDDKKEVEELIGGGEVPMLVLDSKCGAGVVPAFFEELPYKLPASYLLPSSTMEMLIVPAVEGAIPEMLLSMVYEINRTEVAPEDVLSDNIYYFDGKSVTMIESSCAKDEVCA